MACSDRPCHHPAGLDCALGWRRHRAYQARSLHPGRRLYLIGSRGHEAGLAVIRAAGVAVTARPGSGAGCNGDRVRSVHVETRSLIVADRYRADRDRRIRAAERAERGKWSRRWYRGGGHTGMTRDPVRPDSSQLVSGLPWPDGSSHSRRERVSRARADTPGAARGSPCHGDLPHSCSSCGRRGLAAT